MINTEDRRNIGENGINASAKSPFILLNYMTRYECAVNTMRLKL